MKREQLKKLERDLWVAADKLPETYERAFFKQRCDNVFDLVIDCASRGRKWAA